MRRAEGIVDVALGERCQLAAEVGVVGLLSRLEAHVFEHHHLARPDGAGGEAGFHPHDTGDHINQLAQQLAQPGCQRFDA